MAANPWCPKCQGTGLQPSESYDGRLKVPCDCDESTREIARLRAEVDRLERENKRLDCGCGISGCRNVDAECLRCAKERLERERDEARFERDRARKARNTLRAERDELRDEITDQRNAAINRAERAETIAREVSAERDAALRAIREAPCPMRNIPCRCEREEQIRATSIQPERLLARCWKRRALAGGEGE